MVDQREPLKDALEGRDRGQIFAIRKITREYKADTHQTIRRSEAGAGEINKEAIPVIWGAVKKEHKHGMVALKRDEKKIFVGVRNKST